MNIKWLGHSSFLITSQRNQKIITDPYTVGRGIKYDPINESADIVTVSHSHGDHSNSGGIQGNPKVIMEAGSQTIKGLSVKAVQVFHDDAEGSKRGNDLAFCFDVDGMNLCHLGDLGHQLNGKQLAEIGNVDVLLIPVGGYYTIDAKEATAVADSIKPKIIIPMHYKTLKADYPITGVDDFLKGKKNIRKLNSSEVEIKKETLPKETEIVVLQSAN